MTMTSDRIYGSFSTSNLIQDLLKTKPLQRLAHISQGGYLFLSYPKMSVSRLEHSLGVARLIQTLGGTEKEQVAGLLHDISHTAFSHVIDYVLENNQEDFHEKIKQQSLKEHSLSDTLEKHGYSWKDFEHEDDYSLLEAPLPELCADRIDYTLRDMVAWGRISQQEAQEFVTSLTAKDGKIVVTSIEMAQWFQTLYFDLNNVFYKDSKNIYAANRWTELLRDALNNDNITIDDFYQDDNYVLKKLQTSEDFAQSIQAIKKTLATGNLPNEVSNFKDRSVDPPVYINSEVKPLSTLK